MALGNDWPRTDTANWRDQASCKTRPDLNWYPGQGEQFDEQLAVCAGCPVRDDCIAEALAATEYDDLGIWGGMSQRQRTLLRRGQRNAKTRRPVAECGTRSGYMRHRKDGTVICEDCRAANAAYQREMKARNRRP